MIFSRAEEGSPALTGAKGKVNPMQTGGDRLRRPPPGGPLIQETTMVFGGDEVGMVIVEILDDETSMLHVTALEQIGLL